MAYADYMLCGHCGCKSFYDAHVDYENANIGQASALCKSCAETYQMVLVPRITEQVEHDEFDYLLHVEPVMPAQESQ